MKHKIAAAGIVLLLAAVLSAADAAGKWKGSFETPEGSATLVFDLKTAGDVLSGTVSGLPKPAEIKDGKVQGDVITFSFVTEYQGNPLETAHAGPGERRGDQVQHRHRRRRMGHGIRR